LTFSLGFPLKYCFRPTVSFNAFNIDWDHQPPCECEEAASTAHSGHCRRCPNSTPYPRAGEEGNNTYPCVWTYVSILNVAPSSLLTFN
jgi:hypothetical protein